MGFSLKSGGKKALYFLSLVSVGEVGWWPKKGAHRAVSGQMRKIARFNAIFYKDCDFSMVLYLIGDTSEMIRYSFKEPFSPTQGETHPVHLQTKMRIFSANLLLIFCMNPHCLPSLLISLFETPFDHFYFHPTSGLILQH